MIRVASAACCWCGSAAGVGGAEVHGLGDVEVMKNKCLWLKYPLWFTKKTQDLNSHPQVAIQAHKKQCNAITESWICGVPNSTRFGLN